MRSETLSRAARTSTLSSLANDLRFFGSKEQRDANITAILRRLHARHIKVIVFENTIVPVKLYQWGWNSFQRRRSQRSCRLFAAAGDRRRQAWRRDFPVATDGHRRSGLVGAA
jgi:hypothetical protein